MFCLVVITSVDVADMCCRQKVCERLVRTKVVQLQSELKQAAVALIKQMDVPFTLKVDEISAAQRSLHADVTSARCMIDAARANVGVDGVNGAGVLENISSHMASVFRFSSRMLKLMGK